MSPSLRRPRRSDRPRAVLLLVAAVVAGAALTQGAPQTSPPPQEPRFRGGTNLVRLDVYVSADGTAVTDLTADDFEVLEDSAPQQVTSFELVRPRGVVPDSARVEPNTVAESRERAAQPDARVFVLFLDTLHVQVEGSYHAQNPIATLLDRIVGEDDLIGVMTPEMSARNVTYSPRTAPVDRMLADNWTWGKRGSAIPADPREDLLKMCYPDVGETTGLARALIERRRERSTLNALDDLLTELERQREERTFVLLLTEGWVLPRSDNNLARVLNMPGGQRMPGGPVPIGTDPEGRVTTGDAAQGGPTSSRASANARCWRSTTWP